MEEGSSPSLEVVDCKAIIEVLTVKEVKQLLKDWNVDVRGCIEKSELVDALVKRIVEDPKATASLFSYCRICCSWRLDDDVWPLTCGHLACFDCLGSHLESQVQRMKASLQYRLPCIFAPACQHEIRFQDAAEMSAALRKIGKDLKDRERLIKDAKFEVLECPKPDCVGVAYYERGRRMAMCFMCEHTWEANASGREEEWEKPGFNGERVRRCPKCQSPIEKNGGCNHMTCRYGRHFDWSSSQSAGEPAGPRRETRNTEATGGDFDAGDVFRGLFGGFGSNRWEAHVADAAHQVFNVASQAAHHAAHHAQHAAAHAQAHAQAAQAAQAASAGVGRPPQSGFVPNPPRETREGGTATQECAVM